MNRKERAAASTETAAGRRPTNPRVGVTLRLALSPTLFLVLVLCCASARVSAVVLLRFSFLSDVHFDPAYGTPDAYGTNCDSLNASVWGTNGCDAPLSLIESALNDSATEGPDILLFGGDWLRHGFSALPISAATPAFQTVANAVARAAPTNRSSVFTVPNFEGALGNNDFVPDYAFNVSAPRHVLLANQSVALGNAGLLSEDEVGAFGKCGFYSRLVRPQDGATSTLRVVVLNTVMYSLYLSPPLALTTTDPCGQFQFLNATLLDARLSGQKVLVIGHVPPGMNLFGVLAAGMSDDVQDRQFWRDDFTATYRKIISSFSDVVTLQIFGHTHMFSVLADESLGVPGIVVPSVTRVFSNNPSYFVAEFNADTWELETLRQRFLTVNKSTGEAVWLNGSTANSVFGSTPDVFHNGQLSQLASAATNLIGGGSEWAQFQQMHEGGVVLHLFPNPPGSVAPPTPGDCNHECRVIVVCSMLHVSWADISACVDSGGPASASTKGGSAWNVAVPVCVVVILLALVLVVFVRQRRMKNNGQADEERRRIVEIDTRDQV